MSGIATAVVAGAVISSVAANKASKKASKAQGKSVSASIAEQQRQFDITQQSLAPFQQAGEAALNQQRILLGLGGTDPNAAERASLQAQLGEIDQQEQDFNARFNTGAEGTEGMVSRAFKNAAGDQDFAGQRAGIQSQLDALPQFTAGSAQEQQQAAFDALNQSPGQQFLRDRAQKNLLRNTSAIGGLGGGNVRSALVQQGVGFAQQDLQNQFGRLGQLAGQGQAAATNIGQFGQQTSGNIGNALIAGGNARASGILNQNQALQQGIQGVTTGLAQSGLFSRTPPPPVNPNSQFGGIT